MMKCFPPGVEGRDDISWEDMVPQLMQFSVRLFNDGEERIRLTAPEP